MMIAKQCPQCRRFLRVEASRCPNDDSPLLTVIQPPQSGDLLCGCYRIASEIGRGTSGVVMAAFDERRGVEVALKLLAVEPAHVSETLERFMREAVALARLRHDHIVALYDFRLSGEGLPVIVTERLPGKTLAESAAIGTNAAIDILIEVASALAHAHSNGILHRDLKPSNVMLVPRPGGGLRAVLLDFGLARLFGQGAARSSRLTLPGQVFSSPAYASPEQLLGQTADTRSDVYSFGCLAMAILTGRAPVQGATVADVITGHARGMAQSCLPAMPAGVPERLESLIYRALSRRPEDRYQSMVELYDELRSILTCPAPATAVALAADEQPMENCGADKEVCSADPAGLALRALRKRACRGDAAALYELSRRFYRGDGVPKNAERALRELKKAVATGLPEAEHVLGNMHAEGNIVERDQERAFELQKKAAASGYRPAICALAGYYRQGLGVEANSAECLRLIMPLVLEQEAAAYRELGLLKMDEAASDEEAARALAWLELAGEGGDEKAQKAYFKLKRKLMA